MIYMHNGILLTYKKEGNPVMCYNMDKTWRLCKMKEEMGTVSWVQDLWEWWKRFRIRDDYTTLWLY